MFPAVVVSALKPLAAACAATFGIGIFAGRVPYLPKHGHRAVDLETWLEHRKGKCYRLISLIILNLEIICHIPLRRPACDQYAQQNQTLGGHG